jgi:peptide/nickel transport system ATP-binding protein
VLTVKNLCISLREGNLEQKVVEDVSFTLKPGESLGIVGESGSGKTITALSILQLLPPGIRISAGEILLDPIEKRSFVSETSDRELPVINLTALSESQMQAYRGNVISMIFQEPMTSLNPSMRCGEQIREAVSLHTDINQTELKHKVLSLMKEVDLPGEIGFYRKYPHQLSGGQRQRIMIAMALAGNPDILIADEPTTALDVTVQKKILELLQEIKQKRKMSMLFISHDLGVISTVCDNALVMYEGKIVESGKVSKLFSKPEHPYTRGLIACRPGIHPAKSSGNNPGHLPTLEDFVDTEGPEKTTDPSYRKEDQSNTSLTQSGTRKTSTVIREALAKSDDDITPLLEVKNLSVEYSLKKNLLGREVRSHRAVNDFSFSIAPGETLGLIGESGCGKSTLGRSIISLIRSREGNILYEGKDVSSLAGKELIQFRQKVQFIFQDPYSSLNPRITAGQSIMEVMKVHGIHPGRKKRKQAVSDLLEQVGLAKEHFERYPHEFSGGQRQRIGLARALATNPELIILDESVSSLDVSVQAVILNLLNDLKNSFGLTYLFISHDLSVVRHMSDRILVMKDGNLMEEGTGEQIFEDPSSTYTRELVDSILIDTPKTDARLF